jgi:multidrug efflux pump subunit AcrA (membrane-fusion protein)
LASITPQFGFRSGSQNAFNFSGYEFFGTPGVLEEGMMVRQRQELIRLPDVSKMLAEIRIHESRVSQVQAGMTAYVRIESIPNRRFKGAVRRVAPMPDSQMSWMTPNLKVFPTDVLIEEQLPELRPGVSARAEIIITNLAKVLSVPIQTVARYRGENVCFVKKGRGVAPVSVTTGWFNDQFIEITSGLKEGHQVLLAPVSDEAIEQNGETNEVESVTEQSVRPVPPGEGVAPEDRRMQRRNSDATEEGAPAERRRNRPDPAGFPPNGRESPK